MMFNPQAFVRARLALILCAAISADVTGRARAQAPATAPSTSPATTQPLVTLDFPPDGVEVRVLADIVTKRLGIPILYDEAVTNKKVILRVPVKVPESALLGILGSALRMKGLALVDSEQPGWKQIVPAQNLAAVANAVGPGQPPPEPGSAITQIFTLHNVDPARVIDAVRTLLTQPGGNIQPVPGQRMLIVSDYPSVVQRVEQITRLLDTGGPAVETRFIPLQEADATTVAQAVTQLLATRDGVAPSAPGAVGAATSAPGGVTLTPDERLNQIAVVAPADRMKEVADLIAGLDRPVRLETKVYRLKNVSPERIDRLMHDLLGPAGKRTYQGSVDRETGALVVAATSDVLRRLDDLTRELDSPIASAQSPIQFYKLKNTKAVDVLATIAGLFAEQQQNESAGGGAGTNVSSENPEAPATGMPNNPAARPMSTPGNTPQSSGFQNNPAARPLNVSGSTAGGGGMTTTTGGASGTLAGLGTLNTGAVADLGNLGGAGTGAGGATSGAVSSVRAANATVSADVNTNSIIVIAQPAVQQLYADLIKRLDERRPQVQIECTIVTLDTTDNFQLAVDLTQAGGFGAYQTLAFSSFGVSTLDPLTGNLTPKAATGGTFALLSPGNANAVLKTLKQTSRSRLMSAPQLLVNDNGKGQLVSVDSEPFAQILDSTSSQAITSFGGQATAGTTIAVQPHISEDDYLQLDYSVELSSFTGASSNGLPPPSQRNQVTSTVTIPDGYTIVVGGLANKNLRKAADVIPIIGELPGLEWLFGAHSSNKRDTTLFVFIRPIILRNDKFEDLKYLSSRRVEQMNLAGDFPASEPIPLK